MMSRSAPAIAAESPPEVAAPARGTSRRSRGGGWLWAAVAVLVVALGALFVVITGMRPAYDAYGWLVWGHQALDLNLNTNAAPSWKPLSFLFTLPYALLGTGALWLWMVTAVASAFAGAVFAGRIAYRLAHDGAPAWAAAVGAVIAGAAVLGIAGYGHYVLIADSDPMIVTLCLAAIDLHLTRRPRWAWAMLVLAALGRPEVWAALVLYGAWCWRAVPGMRRAVLLGLLVVIVLWFGIPILTSHDFFAAGDVATMSSTPVHGNKFTGVLNRFLSLYEFPMQLAVLVALGVAAVRRDFSWLILAGFAVLWVGVEIAFALHGWGATPRYMFEPAAVLVILVGAAAGRLLGLARSFLSPLRWVAIAAIVALAVTMAPHAQIRGRLLHNGIVLGRQWALQIHRLQAVIARAGGTAAITACGEPVSTVSFQSILAWETGKNVSEIGWSIPYWTSLGHPIVVFTPIGAGWVVTPVHTSRTMVARCRHLNLKTSFNAKTPGARVLKHSPGG